MKISDYIDPLKKKQWRRRIIGKDLNAHHAEFKIMTQDDFLNEVNPDAHIINSQMMSRRPIFGPTGKKNKDGKEEWGVIGYDEIETTPVGLQESIISKKISHFAADGFWTAAESDDEERFSTLMSWADTVGLKTAFIEVIKSAMRTGDGAIYLYQTDNKADPIQYEVYGYEEGSTLFPSVSINGEQSLARKYKYNGHDAVDIFTPSVIQTWMMIDDNEEDGITPIAGAEKSEDGYSLIKQKDAQAGSSLCQCVYFRFEDIPTGPAQAIIQRLEDAKTYVGEHLKGSAMPFLFIKAENTTSLPPTDVANKVIGVKGTSDSLAHSDAKFVAPADASNIAELHINGLEDNIRDTCLSVKIDPEVIKQGSDSSATMKILYAPEVQWAQIHWPEVFKSVKQLMLVFKALVGKVENDATGYAEMRISVGQNIFIPQNSTEALKMEIDSVFARIKSRRAAIQDAGNSHKGDYEQILKEWEEELTMKAEIPAAAKAKYGTDVTITDDDDKNPLDITNQAPGKSIQV